MRYYCQSQVFTGLAFCLLFLVFFTAAARAGGPSIEEESKAAEARLAAFDAGLGFSDRKRIRQTSPQEKDRLGPRLKALYENRESFRKELVFWQEAGRLKRDLLDLPGGEEFLHKEREIRQSEAESVARAAMDAFQELRKRYEMVRPAIFHNLLVNVGLKEEGLCWHWARDVRQKMLDLDLKTFDVQWATAREGTMREHNTVVLTSRGRPFKAGLFLDGWKRAGKPYWMRVAADKKHPWVPGSCAVCGDATQ